VVCRSAKVILISAVAKAATTGSGFRGRWASHEGQIRAIEINHAVSTLYLVCRVIVNPKGLWKIDSSLEKMHMLSP
jgi:hypothetical protein